jgi:hypothetical protein
MSADWMSCSSVQQTCNASIVKGVNLALYSESSLPIVEAAILKLAEVDKIEKREQRGMNRIFTVG